ncbi:DUF2470 domain-containing protein [Microbacterium caowuchunii]|uniref:DUF2470 domain-containing protein n=1 Tax=Microbacterium caowuchunii TaxID=2614638 RepID=UPI001246484B|nr:DUF2470 domain-containing protein [Microbacterium caowuchunii]QEW01277.1 DUF2470 domain-containing protein [Microbacterium caowuchunii]
MAHTFDDETLAGVLGHMNSDHTDDNILIAQAFGADPAPVSATMTGFDGDGGDWAVTSAEGATTTLRVPWPGGSITERREVRREVVALYDAACARLGVEPRPH